MSTPRHHHVPLCGGPKDGETWPLELPLRVSEAPSEIHVPQAITLPRVIAIKDLERVSKRITHLEERLITRHRLLLHYGLPLGPGEREDLLKVHADLQEARRHWDALVALSPRVRFHRYRLKLARGRGVFGWIYAYAGWVPEPAPATAPKPGTTWGEPGENGGTGF